jgi:hypothetical protein
LRNGIDQYHHEGARGSLSLVIDGSKGLCQKGTNEMSDWLWFISFFVVYIVLMRWVLPRLGVPT